MNVFILIRKKQKKAVWLDSKEMIFEYIDDIHNVCFKSVNVAQKYVQQMKPEDRLGIFIVRLKVDSVEEKQKMTPQQMLDKMEPDNENHKIKDEAAVEKMYERNPDLKLATDDEPKEVVNEPTQ